MGNGARSPRNTRRARMVLRNIYLPETVEETLAHRASAQRKSTNQVIREILEKAAQTRASTSRTNRSSRVLE
jgi:plasmid stability protein